jgi:hypothetical protein
MFAARLFPGLLLMASLSCPAQTPTAPSATSSVTDRAAFFAASLTQFLSDSRSFTAGAELQFTGASPSTTVGLGFATHDGQMRWELDATHARSGLPAETVELLRQLSLDRVALVLRPETNLLLIAHGLKAYAELPPPKSAEVRDKAQAQAVRLEKTPLGRESVDGHPCVKYRVANPADKAPQGETFVWQATDLNDLPVKILVKLPEQSYTLKFRNVRMGKPDARYFTAPADYAKHTSVESLLQAGLAKSLGAEKGDGAGLGALGASLKALLGN